MADPEKYFVSLYGWGQSFAVSRVVLTKICLADMGEEEEASPIPIPICQKIREASPISIPTRPDFCWDIIPLEISRLS